MTRTLWVLMLGAGLAALAAGPGPGPGLSRADGDLGCGCPAASASERVCGTDGNTYPSKCALDCATPTVEGLSVARSGPCYPQTRLFSAADGQSLAAFYECHGQCRRDSGICRQGCADGACVKTCVYVELLDCSCACMEHLPSVRSVKPGAVDVFQQILSPGPLGLEVKDVSGYEDATRALRCYDNAMNQLKACPKTCPPAGGDCGLACVRSCFDRICNCRPKFDSMSPKGSGSHRMLQPPALTLVSIACLGLWRGRISSL